MSVGLLGVSRRKEVGRWGVLIGYPAAEDDACERRCAPL
ncbi:hypothetical protein JOD54_002277 [Actinokineospora baliensis]|nr:hypothetical protein [Actinokineospora baliensis]